MYLPSFSGGIAVGAGLLALFYKMFLSGPAGTKKQRCITGGPATWDAPVRIPTKCEQSKEEEE